MKQQKHDILFLFSIFRHDNRNHNNKFMKKKKNHNKETHTTTWRWCLHLTTQVKRDLKQIVESKTEESTGRIRFMKKKYSFIRLPCHHLSELPPITSKLCEAAAQPTIDNDKSCTRSSWFRFKSQNRRRKNSRKKLPRENYDRITIKQVVCV